MPSPDDATEESSPEPTFKILPLHPEFSEPDHGLYLQLLAEALNEPKGTKTRNIALTGSYGIGKSSVLEALGDRFGGRVVNLALSTLGSNADTVAASNAPSGGTPGRPKAPITNLIQKEIVKQLLYREDPSNVPGSRYRRIEGFKKNRALGLAFLAGLVVVLIGMLSGLVSRIDEFARGDHLATVLLYGAFFLATVNIAFWAQRFFHNKVWIEKLSTGPATISLANSSSTYFDEYLDEIVYFFEATGYDIAVFEDLDRFNDPYIFETLRELNTILNNSNQIADKTIRFVYAIKDSIFEQLGSVLIANTALSSSELKDLGQTNRTKFFDLVIPMVPFITHRSSRDLMKQLFKASGFEFSKEIVDLAAAHISDMRLIKNIHNEYGVFESRLLGENGIPGLEPDSLLAMILYKNSNLADFEKIKSGSSNLDSIYRTSRNVIRLAIDAVDTEMRTLQRRMDVSNSAPVRSKSLGEKLETYIGVLMRQTTSSVLDVTVGGEIVPSSDFGKPSFWGKIEKAADPVLTLRVQNPWTTTRYPITRAELQSALGSTLFSGTWSQSDSKALSGQLDDLVSRRAALSRTKIPGLMSDLRFVLPADPDEVGAQPETFHAYVDRVLQSPLSAALLAAGLIDQNFTLYVSQYYGDTLTASAMNFIIHVSQPNEMDIHFTFDELSSIDALLDELGTAALAERSAFNVQLFDFALGKDDARITPTLKRLSQYDDDSKRFIAAYFASGKYPRRLVASLASRLPQVFAAILGNPGIREPLRGQLVSSAIRSSKADVRYEIPPEMRAYIETNYQKMNVFRRSQLGSTAKRVADLLLRVGVKFASLGPIHSTVRGGIVDNWLYTFTAANLRSALGTSSSDLSLDTIMASNSEVFNYTMACLEDYVKIAKAQSKRFETVKDPNKFKEILELVADADSSVLSDVSRMASVTSFVDELSAVKPAVWGALVETNRTRPSYENVTSYMAEFGDIDAALAELLNVGGNVVDLANASDADREMLALSIVNSAYLSAERKVELVVGLELDGYLPLAKIDQQEGKLYGLLLKAGEIEDAQASFEHIRSLSWDTKMEYVRASKAFPGYIDSLVLTEVDLTELARSSTPRAIREAILSDLATLASVANKPALQSLAIFAESEDMILNSEDLLLLASKGVGEAVVVKLMQRSLTSLSRQDLIQILRALGGNYAQLTVPAWRSITLPNNSEHRALVETLERHLLVNRNTAADGDATFKAHMKHK